MIPNSTLKLGQRVVDNVTGYEGVITIWSRTLAGNIRERSFLLSDVTIYTRQRKTRSART